MPPLSVCLSSRLASDGTPRVTVTKHRLDLAYQARKGTTTSRHRALGNKHDLGQSPRPSVEAAQLHLERSDNLLLAFFMHNNSVDICTHNRKCLWLRFQWIIGMSVSSQRTNVVVVTVHGTWASDRGTREAKWWEAHSAFSSAVAERLGRHSVDFKFIEFAWSGANSDRARTAAAVALAKTLKKLTLDGCDNLHIVAHSHGGNVVEEAIARLNRFSLVDWMRRRSIRPQIRTVVSVGTPFFKTSIPLIRRISIGGLLLAVPGIFTFALAGINAVENPPFGPGAPTGGSIVISWAMIFSVPFLSLISLIFFARQAIDVIERSFPRRLVVPSWLAIHHTSDEAISLLKFSERQNIKFFESKTVRLALVRAVETFSILLFSFGVLAGAGVFFIQAFFQGFTSDNRFLPMMPATIAAYAFPILWLVAAILGTFLSPLLAMLGNRLLNGRLQSLAYGQDFQHAISEIQEKPHTLPSTVRVIDGIWSQRMLSNANVALKSSIDKNHAAFFRTDLGFSLEELAARTTADGFFDGLIHTSYFAHEEIVDVVAHHIASS